MLRKLKTFTLLGIMMLTLLCGCSAHVDTYGQTFDKLTTESALGVTFLVPSEIRESATDYNTIINVPYFKQEKVDEAYLNLVNRTIVGTTEKTYILTSARDYVFTVVSVELPAEYDILSASRDEILDPCDIDGFEALNYGRLIANADDKAKAVMRLDFKLTDAMGIKNTYSGYYSLSNIGGRWYCYLAGYKGSTADDNQLKTCFNCVRSLG